MGMSIDEAREWLVSRKEHYEMDDDCQELAQSLSVAIEIMRKYEKIEQILDDCDLEAWEILEKVKEVVENGRN